MKRTYQIHLSRGKRSKLVMGTNNKSLNPPKSGRIPRITRLMALAIYLDQQIRDRKIKDYAEIARLGHVSRARVTQIMNLLNLAPDIQEAILFLPLTQNGRDSIREKMLRPIATQVEWEKQRGIIYQSNLDSELLPKYTGRTKVAVEVG